MDFDALRKFMEAGIPFNRVLGVKLIKLEKGHARLEIPFRDELVGDPFRPALHGGVLSALADTAGGAAVWSGATDMRVRVSTIDLRMDYLRPARLESIVADARVVRMGNRVGVADVTLFHPSSEHEVFATCKAVYNVSPPKKT
jgi:uncharacterized protein (TIGR00369 family)